MTMARYMTSVRRDREVDDRAQGDKADMEGMTRTRWSYQSRHGRDVRHVYATSY
jgi:hypothetical protein